MAFLNVWNSSGKLRVGLSIIFLLTATAFSRMSSSTSSSAATSIPLAQGKFEVFFYPSSEINLLGS